MVAARLIEPAGDGKTLSLAVIGYCGRRFVAEYFRGHRHRLRYLGLSEAQILSVGLVAVAAVGLV